jgi:hypothetical protein
MVFLKKIGLSPDFGASLGRRMRGCRKRRRDWIDAAALF